MDEESVMLSIRLPASLRRNFQQALKKADMTPTEYIRRNIAEFVKNNIDVPIPQKVNVVDIATRYIINGDLPPKNTILYDAGYYNDDQKPKILKSVEDFLPHPHVITGNNNADCGVLWKHYSDAVSVARSMAIDLHMLSVEFIKQDAKIINAKNALEDAQRCLDDD